MSPLIWVITIVTLLITPLITTHEPPSSLPSEVWGLGISDLWHVQFYRGWCPLSDEDVLAKRTRG